MSLNNMVMDEMPSHRNVYSVKKKSAKIGFIILGLAFIISVIITYYLSKSSSQVLYNDFVEDKLCHEFFCNHKEKITGDY